MVSSSFVAQSEEVYPEQTSEGTVLFVSNASLACHRLKKFKVNRHRAPIWLPCVGDEADRYGRKKTSEPPHWSNERGKEEWCALPGRAQIGSEFVFFKQVVNALRKTKTHTDTSLRRNC